MAEFKVVISTKDGKSVQKELKSPEADVFLDKRVGETVKGDEIGFKGYEFEIRGGTDKAGFPMRPDVGGIARKKIFTTSGHGVWIPQKGKKYRKTVAGNTIHEDIAQINLKVLKQGAEPLTAPAEAPAEEGEAKAEEKPAEAPAEKKEEAPAPKPEEKKEAAAPAAEEASA
ncbi:30S ribosomal protein S6e [Candidatus Woesearchaeota archaeon]|nr:30S ribosomal protein S6e [Candidatus Woesearchaeota archaeon]